MDIHEIKNLTKEKSPFFFSEATLRFFGQTMDSFRVKTSPTGRVFIYAPSYDTDGCKMGYTFREFKDGDLVLIKDLDRSASLNVQEFAIEAYIQRN